QSHGRRTVQDDDGHQYGARTLPRRGPRTDRHAWWTGRRHVRDYSRHGRIYQNWQVTCACRDDCDAVGGAAGGRACRRLPTGLRGEFLGRHGRAQGTSAEIIETLNREINTALVDVKVTRRFDEFGGLVLAGSPAEFETFIAKDTDKWGKVVRFAGL